MGFGENNVLGPKYIDIYEFRGVRGGRTYSTVHFLFIQKNGKSTKVQNQILHRFYFFYFPRTNNKKITKRGPMGPHSYFFMN